MKNDSRSWVLWRTSVFVVVLVFSNALLGCGPKPRPIFRTPPDVPPREGPPESTLSKNQLEEISDQWLGTPYRYGGVDRRGIDCSALARNILGDLGTTIPRTVRDQREVGRSVEIHDVRPGDLVFFRLEAPFVNHVGVAIDRQRFVHASASRGVVVDYMMDKYFSRRFAEARRVFNSN